jgi:carbonic anhydrase
MREGNQRFASNVLSIASLASQTRRHELVMGQHPFAIVLGCSDARAPAETVFDQGLGDLFVIRVAGNIVAPSQIGSIEFAAERFGVRLVVVMGHSHCGAVAATIEAVQQPEAKHSRNMLSIVDRIRPAIEPLIDTDVARNADLLMRAAVRSNVQIAADHARHGSPLLERLQLDEDLLIVGANYDIESGNVVFFDGVPDE